MAIRPFGGVRPRIAPDAWVDETALVVGDVEIGPQSSLWPMVVARGDVHWIRIGARTNVQDGSVLHVTHAGERTGEGHPLRIGDEVTVGHRAVLHGCTVGDRCLIGMGAVVMDGAEIGPESIVAAGALVPPGRRLEGGWLWVGSPVERRRPLRADEREWLAYSAAHYVALARRHAGA
ncbi:MAG TPA: gamma carbonic anhydrase family protein [Chromatiales bacterium]|nr:gamma carbonic anhydrase family protein [Chromatiales bacterium]